MDAPCIVCNWYGGLGLALGLGGLGAAAAGAFGGLGRDGFSGRGAGGAWPEPAYDYPRVPPSYRDRENGRVRYRDTSGNPYWPSISPIPDDGVVHPGDPRQGERPIPGEGWRGGPLSVNPENGMPVWPPSPLHREDGTTERPTAAITSAGRG